MKRLLGYSGVAQAGYMLGGVVVASESGASSLIFYLAAYAFMNLAAFAVIVARERETVFGDDIRALQGLGASRPLLAWPLTISMLALAGLPATAGFIGKLYLIEALVEGDGSPAIAGAAPEGDPIDPEASRRIYLVAPALLAAAATVFFGIIPQPLVDFAAHAGASLF